MDTTRNAETPPNFAPKTFQKWLEKLPNVASETLEKKRFLGCLWRSFPVALKPATLQHLATRNSSTDGPLETLKHHLISRPKHSKTSQKWPEKLPNVASETLEKNNFWAAFGVAFLSPVALKPSTLQLCNAQQLYWWTPLETLKHHLISRPKHPKSDQKNSLTSLLKP